MHDSKELNIRAAVPSDAVAIAEIYNHYVGQTIITFEEHPVPPIEIAKRIEQIQSKTDSFVENQGRSRGHGGDRTAE